MKVKQLIEELLKCENQEALIFIYKDDTIHEIDLIDDNFEFHERVDINIKN